MVKNIHFIWVTRNASPVPTQCTGFLRQWQALHSGYTLKVWGISDLYALNNERLASMLGDQSLDMAAIADYARLLIVEKYGGLYADIDTQPLKNFDRLLNACKGMLFGVTRVCRQELNLFYAEPQNPVLRLFIKHYVSPRNPNAYDWLTAAILGECTVCPPQFFHAYKPTEDSYSLHWPHRLSSWGKPLAN